MKKLLLSILSIAIGTTLFAQKSQQLEQASETVNLQHRMQMQGAPRAITCVDTLYYGELKQLRVGRSINASYTGPIYFFSLWQVDQEAMSQIFHFSGGTLSLNKVIVPGRINPDLSGVSSATVAVEVFNVGANNVPTTLIGSTTITMSSSSQQNYYANFSTPLTITGNYAISIRPTTSTAVIDMIISDFVNNQAWDEDLCKLKSADINLNSYGEWVSPQTYTSNYSQGSMNFDLCVAPIISYSADATLSASSTAICLGDEVEFNAAITPNGGFSNRMMSYQTMLSYFNVAAVDSTFAWNVNTANNAVLWGSANLTHVYPTAGTFNTRFYGIGGFRSTCLINMAGPSIRVVDGASLESQVQFTAAATAVCEDAEGISLTGLPAGGTFGGDFVSASIFSVEQATIGSHNLTYTVMVDVCEITKTLAIVVNEYPIVTFGSVDDLCIDGAAHTLVTGLPVGGSYTASVVNDGVLLPSQAGIGTHTVTYTYSENGCEASAVQDIVVAECLSIGQLIENTTNVYPNPATQSFTIDVNTTDAIDFTLISLEGKIIYNNMTLNAGVNTIDVKGLTEGVYIVRLQSGNEVQIQKITLN